MSSETPAPETAKRGDPWRWRCPEGHASWLSRSTAPTSERYRCDVCGVTFAQLVDARELADA